MNKNNLEQQLREAFTAARYWSSTGLGQRSFSAHHVEAMVQAALPVLEGLEEGWQASRESGGLLCACGAPAACIGSYEGHPIQPACNDCCGHGEEDGWCVLCEPAPASGEPSSAEALRSALTQAAQWFDEYAEIHDRKGDEAKKRRNQTRADYCRDALRNANAPSGAEART